MKDQTISQPPTDRPYCRAVWPEVPAVLLLAGCSVLALGLLMSRQWLYDRKAFTFLPWNLFLAWVPLGAAVAVHLVRRIETVPRAVRWAILCGLAVVWLVFFPNSFYLITDLLHFNVRPGVPRWFDLMILASFACLGVQLGYVSLRLIHRWAEDWFGRLAGWLTVLGTLALTSVGVFLGRFWRWNSWDLLRPSALWEKYSENEKALSPKESLLFLSVFLVFSLIAYCGTHAAACVPAAPEKKAPLAEDEDGIGT